MSIIISESAALEHVSIAERMAHEIPGIGPGTVLRNINQVGIVGAGTMGGGIAMNFVNAGIPVVLLELNNEALQRGLGIIHDNYERSRKKGKLTREQLDERMALISGTVNYKTWISRRPYSASWIGYASRVQSSQPIPRHWMLTRSLLLQEDPKTSLACIFSAPQMSCACLKWCAAN